MNQTAFVKSVLRTAMSAGWVIAGVDNGEERDIRDTFTPITAVKKALEVDEAVILLRHPDHEKLASLFVVWQGPVATYPYGEEAVSDYSMSLDPVVETAYKLAGC
jgi:hypothetical protein